jgi:pimeloyl-ACP methyl ester carboxylesterase
MTQAGDRAFYLDAGGEATLCRLQPAEGCPSGHAVVLVPPFGWDEICSYRPRRAWAQHLAAGGTPVLRLDLPGTGDSAGGPHDADRLEAWTSAVAAASSWLSAELPAARVTLAGLGLGGLLAWRAVAAGAAADDLVLWATPARGKALVREIRAFSRLERSRLAELNPGRTLPADDDGALVANGFALSAQTVADLQTVDLTALALPGADRRRVLLLGRDGVAPDAGLLAAAEAQGAQVAVDSGQGWGRMVDEPMRSVAPRAAFALVDAWLAEAPAGRVAPRDARAPAASPEAVVATPDGDVLERPIRIGELDGIRAEPLDDAETPGLTLLMLNAGSIRRVGPNRMWVELGRRWAARGLVTVRLDFAGIGEAPGPENFADDPLRYSRDPAFGERAAAAVEPLAAGGAPPRFASVGLCSGAYWSLQAALRDPRVRATYLVNPRTLVWDEAIVAERDTRKVALLARPSTYRRVLRGDIPVRRGAEIAKAVLIRLGPALAGVPGRLRHRRRRGPVLRDPVDPLTARLDLLDRRGQRTHFIFTGGEPVHEELERDGHLARRDRWPTVDVQLLDELRDVHTLQPVALQREVHALIDAAIAADLDAAGAQMAV